MLKEYLQRKNKKSALRINDNVHLNFLAPLPGHINVGSVMSYLQKIDDNFLNCVDGIYITHLPEFDKRNINAIFKDNAIYVTNRQDSVEDLLDDIVHELGHALEDRFNKVIYDDCQLQSEFLHKRDELWDRLSERNHQPKHIGRDRFLTVDYNKSLDKWFAEDFGYDNLRNIANDLFASPYGATSLREYWANGFENYLMGNKEKVKSSSPILFDKIEEILASTDKKFYEFE